MKNICFTKNDWKTLYKIHLIIPRFNMFLRIKLKQLKNTQVCSFFVCDTYQKLIVTEGYKIGST